MGPRNPGQALTDAQKGLEEDYEKLAALLVKGGWRARYVRFVVYDADQQPGYITLEA